MTLEQYIKHFNSLLEEFESAVREHENIGFQRPEDFETIEKSFELSKETLVSFIMQIPRPTK